ncbi:hypothetical protein GCK32_018756 [Trichostrongylus colubriformis]|uniref:AB hydrolase-1 domain-containing protein n=1 Tax=Trichostrongylus colubriformis TaxID=6319 RepID=A0AAN8FAT5_TRICO
MLSNCAGSKISKLPKCYVIIQRATNTSNVVDPFLRRINVRFTTSLGDEIAVEAVYQDTSPSGSRLGTVVAIHGAPGSHKDYKYVTPLLQSKGIRFIGVNMPYFGLTPGDPRLRFDNTERNNFVNELISRIGNVEKLVVMGHSRGSENAVAVADRNAVRLLNFY